MDYLPLMLVQNDIIIIMTRAGVHGRVRACVRAYGREASLRPSMLTWDILGYGDLFPKKEKYEIRAEGSWSIGYLFA